MTEKHRPKIKIDRKKEMRTREISRMIDEGGLGADVYYKIIKESQDEATNDEQESIFE